IIKNLEEQMGLAAKELAFERASELRDQIKALKKMIVFEL
ncbi:MAG: UvrB/UvrC motif-containing protein, partial [Deltaproteobacteria bacterium]|nr:UvrB/UvrC motif-containing protein [Deltaproteobacteria bacterium]